MPRFQVGSAAQCRWISYDDWLLTCRGTVRLITVSATNASSPPLQIVVMAAGQGKRMQSARPKALHPLAGRPLVSHALDAVRTLAPHALIVVVGHGAEQVR